MLRSTACVVLASSLVGSGLAPAQEKHVSATPASDARPPSLEEAVRVALDELWGIETLGELCVARDPKNARYHQAAAFFWRSENRDALYVARTAPKRLPPEATRRTRAVEVLLDDDPGACVEHSRSVFGGELSLGRTVPGAERALLEDLAKHPMPEPEWAERETALGCIKKSLNDDMDYAVAVRRCECAARAFVEASTPAERKAYWKTLEGGREEARWDWLSKKLPALMKRCGEEWK